MFTEHVVIATVNTFSPLQINEAKIKFGYKGKFQRQKFHK